VRKYHAKAQSSQRREDAFSSKKPIGILRPQAEAVRSEVILRPPSAALEPWIEHFWSVAWDLRGQPPFLQETLPHPSVHIVFQPEGARVVGVVTGKFGYRLEGEGWVFGVRFRPGSFYPVVRTPVAHFTDRVVPLAELFGDAGTAWAEATYAAADDPARVALAERFLLARLPAWDETLPLIHQMVDRIRTDAEVRKVEDLAERFHLAKRSVQRLFHQYVGTGPKWVIQRYRLHEAAEKLAGPDPVEWTALALELGYFDQAHFIKDFKSIVGRTPAEYARVAREQASAPDVAQGDER
jgi:AraC-like DNA-binding protein